MSEADRISEKQEQVAQGSCQHCNGITFHVLVSVPAPGELARETVALECTNCGGRISLREGG